MNALGTQLALSVLLCMKHSGRMQRTPQRHLRAQHMSNTQPTLPACTAQHRNTAAAMTRVTTASSLQTSCAFSGACMPRSRCVCIAHTCARPHRTLVSGQVLFYRDMCAVAFASLQPCNLWCTLCPHCFCIKVRVSSLHFDATRVKARHESLYIAPPCWPRAETS